MYLAITLNKLGDFENSCAAFRKAIELDSNDCTVYLNYAIVLHNNGHSQKAKEIFNEAQKVFETLEEEDREPEIMDQRSLLMEALGI
jgi:Bardet-Biedl syndrome 4 protein